MSKDVLSPLIMVMEAKKSKTTDIKIDPKQVKDTNDYSNDDEKDTKDTDEDIDDKKEDNDDGNIVTGNDYSVEDDEIGDDDPTDNDYSPGNLDDNGDDPDNGGGDDFGDPESNPEGGEGNEEPVTGNDYGNTEDGSDGEKTDPNSDTEQGTNQDVDPEDDSEKLKSLFLYKDFRRMQSFILNNTDKIRKTNRTSFIVKEIDNQVISNFEKLYDLVNNYMIFKFKNNKYVVNLLNYNNFVMLIKINIQMLKKISNSKSNV